MTRWLASNTTAYIIFQAGFEFEQAAVKVMVGGSLNSVKPHHLLAPGFDGVLHRNDCIHLDWMVQWYRAGHEIRNEVVTCHDLLLPRKTGVGLQGRCKKTTDYDFMKNSERWEVWRLSTAWGAIESWRLPSPWYKGNNGLAKTAGLCYWISPRCSLDYFCGHIILHEKAFKRLESTWLGLLRKWRGMFIHQMSKRDVQILHLVFSWRLVPWIRLICLQQRLLITWMVLEVLQVRLYAKVIAGLYYLLTLP